jgi:hypothetical protein
MNDDLEADVARMLARRASDLGPEAGLDPNDSLALAKEAMMRTRAAVSIATAAAIVVLGAAGAVVLANRPADEPGVATDPTPSAPAEPTPSVIDTEPVSLPVYYLGDTPRGPRLYREFRSVQTADALSAAVDLAVSESPSDPDYRTPWGEGVGATASYDGDVLTVDLLDDTAAGLHDRPAGMSPEESAMALEQVIFTAQAALGEGRVPVQFLLDGQRTDQVLGQPTAEPLSNGPVLETLSLVNITTPAEGSAVSGSLSLTGVANSFEANVVVTLQRTGSTEVDFQEGVMAEGWMGERLFPFAATIDLADLEPGSYVLTAMTDDPSGGAEGFGPFSDTKVITVD